MFFVRNALPFFNAWKLFQSEILTNCFQFYFCRIELKIWFFFLQNFMVLKCIIFSVFKDNYTDVLRILGKHFRKNIGFSFYMMFS